MLEQIIQHAFTSNHTQEIVIGTLTFLDTKEEESESESSEDEQETPSRRMTRHAYAEEVRKSRSTKRSAADSVESTVPEVETGNSGRSSGQYNDIFDRCFAIASVQSNKHF